MRQPPRRHKPALLPPSVNLLVQLVLFLLLFHPLLRCAAAPDLAQLLVALLRAEHRRLLQPALDGARPFVVVLASALLALDVRRACRAPRALHAPRSQSGRPSPSPSPSPACGGSCATPHHPSHTAPSEPRPARPSAASRRSGSCSAPCARDSSAAHRCVRPAPLRRPRPRSRSSPPLRSSQQLRAPAELRAPPVLRHCRTAPRCIALPGLPAPRARWARPVCSGPKPALRTCLRRWGPCAPKCACKAVAR